MCVGGGGGAGERGGGGGGGREVEVTALLQPTNFILNPEATFYREIHKTSIRKNGSQLSRCITAKT